jgi:hypothetical protein
MDQRATGQITIVVAASAPLIAGLTYAVAGARPAMGAAVGGAVALANWAVLRYLAARLIARRTGSPRVTVAGLLVVKMAAMMGLCWVLIAKLGIHPVGFAAGLGALVIGVIVGAATGFTHDPLVAGSAAPASPSASRTGED